jgi:mitogen-activated protein kinase 1/3
MHRDLKPENILVTEDMQVKICDFGLSRSIVSKQKEGKKIRSTSPICFTRYYRPPEVILSKPDYNETSDMWSVGCILSLIFQKTIKSNDDVEIPFCGDSCFPMSPIGQSGDDCSVSSNDQMLSIIRNLNVKSEEAGCFKDLPSHDYLLQLITNDRQSISNSNLQR